MAVIPLNIPIIIYKAIHNSEEGNDWKGKSELVVSGKFTDLPHQVLSFSPETINDPFLRKKFSSPFGSFLLPAFKSHGTQPFEGIVSQSLPYFIMLGQNFPWTIHINNIINTKNLLNNNNIRLPFSESVLEERMEFPTSMNEEDPRKLLP